MKSAFGLPDHAMLPKIDRLLKGHGLKLRVERNRNWGDQVKVTVEPICSTCKGARRIKKSDGLGSRKCPDCDLRDIEEKAAEARRTGKLPRGWSWASDPNSTRGRRIPMPPEGYGS